MSEAKREPLFHISKRTDISWQKALLIRVIAIALALGASAIICLLLTDDDPLAIYSTIIKGTFGTPRKTWVTFRDVAMLLCISLAVTPAFKMRFWNIGGEGQTLMGCLASASCMILLRDVLPNWALILVMLLTSMLAGAIWGGIPALFKAKWNTNETLFTLMMNYVATQLVAYFCIFWESPKGSGKIGIINQRSQIGWLPKVADQQYLLNIIVVGVLVLLMFLYLYNSSFDTETKRINYDFYQPRTIHESSLSPAIHSILAAELDKMDEAVNFFGYATRLDLDNYNRNTREGLHITSIAMAWANIVYGFAGLRSDDTMLRFAPRLPERWKRLTFSVMYRGRVIAISMGADKTVFQLMQGDKLAVQVYGETVELTDEPISVQRQ